MDRKVMQAITAQYVKKCRYKCPNCSKRFKAVPAQTIYSPYPICPRCGVPVSEANAVRSFDRTRKVLWALSWPARMGFKVSLMPFIGTKFAAVGVFKAARFVLSLPLNIIKELRRRRFADPATLEKYLAEVKDQFGNVQIPGGVLVGTIAKDKAPARKAVKVIDTTKVILSRRGRLELADSRQNPHSLTGTIVDTNNMFKQVMVRWDNGETNGPYAECQIERLSDVKTVR